MTAVQFHQLWLTDVTDPSDALVLRIAPKSTEIHPNLVLTEEWAAGRYRAIGRDGISRVWTPQLLMMPVPVARALQRRAGDLHWARDPWGGRIACTWANPVTTWEGWVEGHGQQMATVALTLVESTYQEV